MMIFENLLGLFSFMEFECNLNAYVKDNNIQNNHVPKLQYNKNDIRSYLTQVFGFHVMNCCYWKRETCVCTLTCIDMHMFIVKVGYF